MGWNPSYMLPFAHIWSFVSSLSLIFFAFQFTLTSFLKFSFTKTSVHFASFSFTLFLLLRVHYVSLYRKFASQSLVSLSLYLASQVRNFASLDTFLSVQESIRENSGISSKCLDTETSSGWQKIKCKNEI